MAKDWHFSGRGISEQGFSVEGMFDYAQPIATAEKLLWDSVTTKHANYLLRQKLLSIKNGTGGAGRQVVYKENPFRKTSL